MPPSKPVSAFVKQLMPNASPAEIEDATDRWFGFIEILDRMVERLEKEAPHLLPVQKRDGSP